MKIVLLFLATLTAIGQSTLTQTWYHPPCKAGDQQGAGITGPDAPKWQDEKTGLWCIHIVQPKKHKAQVKPAWDMTPPIDDGVAHWQAPKQSPGLTAIAEAIMEVCRKYCTGDGNCMVCDQKQPPVAEAITCEGCGSGDNLPLTVNKESCTTIYKGKWSDDTKTCYLVEQLGAVGAMMEQIAPEKAAVREWKSDSCWMPNTTTDACKLDPMSCLEWLEHCPAGGVPGPGMGDLVQPPADHKGWTGLPDPLKTAQDGYDVPPINEEYGTLGFQWCDMGQCIWEDYDPDSALQKALGNKPHRRTRLTCVDKTRFLMTSEDGKQHCIKL